MKRTQSYTVDKPFDFVKSRLNDLASLVKFRLSIVVVFTAVAAYIIASGGNFNWTAVALLAIGGFLVTASANALNEVLEKDYDKLMTRTANRPVAAGRISISEAVLTAGFMCLIGTIILALFNPLTAMLGMMALISYAFVYTPLKRYSTIAVFIGAIPGALPMAIGCVAFDGSISTLAIALFTIQFCWQFPHFWAIAYLGFDDYSKAGFKFLPLKNGQLDRGIGWQGFVFALLIFSMIAYLYTNGLVSVIAAIILGIMNLIFCFFAFDFARSWNRKKALTLMISSFFFLPIVLVILLIEILL